MAGRPDDCQCCGDAQGAVHRYWDHGNPRAIFDYERKYFFFEKKETKNFVHFSIVSLLAGAENIQHQNIACILRGASAVLNKINDAMLAAYELAHRWILIADTPHERINSEPRDRCKNGAHTVNTISARAALRIPVQNRIQALRGLVRQAD